LRITWLTCEAILHITWLACPCRSANQPRTSRRPVNLSPALWRRRDPDCRANFRVRGSHGPLHICWYEMRTASRRCSPGVLSRAVGDAGGGWVGRGGDSRQVLTGCADVPARPGGHDRGRAPGRAVNGMKIRASLVATCRFAISRWPPCGMVEEMG
jgi:hypothetical protein